MTNQLLLTLISHQWRARRFRRPARPTAPKGPQPISRDRLHVARQWLQAIEANKDGFTDRAEIEAAEAKALAARKSQQLKQREAAFRQLDKDKNGSLSLSEFNAAVAAQSPKANATPRIIRLDTNKDGKVSMAESRAPAEAQFARLDSNKDGILSVDEQRRPAARQR